MSTAYAPPRQGPTTCQASNPLPLRDDTTVSEAALLAFSFDTHRRCPARSAVVVQTRELDSSLQPQVLALCASCLARFLAANPGLPFEVWGLRSEQ